MSTGTYGQTYPIVTPQHPSNRINTVMILDHSLPQTAMTATLADQISKNITHALTDAVPPTIIKRIAVGLMKSCAHSLTVKEKDAILKGMATLLTASKPLPQSSTEPLAQDPLFLKWMTEHMGPEFTDPTTKEAWEALRKRWVEGADYEK